MSKWMGEIVGGLEIAGGIVIDAVTAGTGGNFLIAMGISSVVAGCGTLLPSPVDHGKGSLCQ